MGEFVTQFLVLVLAVATITVMWKFFGDKLINWRELASKPGNTETEDNSDPIGRIRRDHDNSYTCQMPTWKILIHNSKGTIEMPVVLNKDMFTIGKDKNCDCLITGSNYVGRIHAIVSQDMDGYFIQDNDSVNGMYLSGNSERQKEISITNGLCIKLANVKITFKKIDVFGDDDGGTKVPTPRRSRSALIPGTKLAERG